MKLLAARQKAFALAEGVDTGFKIEANMTISDIASMLPPREAKRWNAWDTDYLFGDSKSGADENDSKLVAAGGDFKNDKRHTSDNLKSGHLYSGKGPGSQSKEDVEEELVLIYSFVNSKNTINSLPGPYRTAYEVPKHFKLRFDSVRLCQEEDVHMFPTSPPSNSRYAFAPRGILKGGRNHMGKLEKEKVAQPKKSADSHSRGAKEHRQAEITVSHSASSNSLLDSIAPMHVINSARQLNGAVSQHHDHSASSGGHDSRHSSRPPAASNGWATDGQSSDAKASSSGGAQQKQRLNDLYGFVGMDGGKDSALHTRAETKLESNHHQPPLDATSSRVSSTLVPLSAEERLRNLMADMQRQNYGVSSASGASHSGATPLSASGGRNRTGEQIVRESTIPAMDFTASNPLRQQQQQQPNTPSLYDLANMHFGASNPQRSTKTPQDASGRSSNALDSSGAARSSSSREYGQYMSAPLPLDEDADPLSAFDMPSNASTSSSRGNGAVRARHDIVPNQQQQQQSYLNNGRGGVSYPPPPRVPQGAVKTAWSDSPSSQQQQANSRGAISSSRSSSSGNPSGSGSRHPSPSLRQQQQGSSLSVTSIHSGHSAANSQGNSQQQQQTAVGSGTSSGSRVYRHGSPAPNAVRSSRSSMPAVGSSSGSGYGGGSVGSAGTLGSVGGGPGPSAHRTNLGAAPAQARHSTSSGGSRPASPMSARGTAPMAINPRDQQSGTPQRRLSSNSVHTINSDNANTQQSVGQSVSQQDRRRSGSPLLVRSSQNAGPALGASGSGGGGGTAGSKRFSTPTPQSSQHHDYEVGGTARGAVRSGTPTKSSWKF
eukprot:gene24455-30806_t